MHVPLDGFDPGIMFTAAEDDNWRDRMMPSVAPIWDFDETWLLLGDTRPFAVFHIAHAVSMPALYVPIRRPPRSSFSRSGEPCVTGAATGLSSSPSCIAGSGAGCSRARSRPASWSAPSPRCPKPSFAMLTAFLAGGGVLNVLKEEVPSERQSRFGAFAAGVAGYAALLLTL